MALQLSIINMSSQLISRSISTIFLGGGLRVYEIYWVITYIYNICKTAMIPKIHNLYIISIIKLCNFDIWCKRDRDIIFRNENVNRHLIQREELCCSDFWPLTENKISSNRRFYPHFDGDGFIQIWSLIFFFIA